MTEADWIKAGVSGLTVALGVILGLLGNSYVNWQREKRVYRGLLGVVVSEAKSNKVILEESFLQYYSSGLVFREFSIAIVAHCVGDQLFVKYAKPTHLQAIYNYLRAISLANAYREKAEYLQLEVDSKNADGFLKGLVEVWGQNLEQCRHSMDRIINLA